MPSIPICIAADHAVFAGHFPGRPIVPGVLLLDTVLLELEAATGLQTRSLASAKFLSPAVPGEPLSLSYEIDGSLLRFDIHCESRKVATGRFVIDPESLA